MDKNSEDSLLIDNAFERERTAWHVFLDAPWWLPLNYKPLLQIIIVILLWIVT
jgi:hypothetical protein